MGRMGVWTEADIVRIMCQQQGQPPELPAVLTTIPERPAYWPYRSQLEYDYAVLLEQWKQTGLIRQWSYETHCLKLAPKTTLTVDWYLWMADSSHQLHETKGAWHREDGWQKLKQAAALFPGYRFFKVQREAKQWQWQEVPAA